MEEPAEDYEALPEMHLEGKVLADRYRILRRIGDGGMATVYLGEHTSIEKQCAIKVLNIAYAHQQDAVDRFLREARSASRIQHENVIDITDFGRAPNGSVFFVMELLAGEDLATTVRREGPIAWPRVRHLALQMCRALAAAHARGIIHRDMKPENVFRVQRGGDPDFIKVLDFGIARVVHGTAGGRNLTSAGSVFGTPAYMSPEQCDGRPADARSDVYSVGVVLFELLTGRPPFMADSPLGFLKQHCFDEPPGLRATAPEAGIPGRVEAVVLRALAKDPELRFAGMEALASALEAVDAAVLMATREEPMPRRGWRIPAIAGALTLGVGIAVVGLGGLLVGEDAPAAAEVVAAPVVTPPVAPAPAVVATPEPPTTVVLRVASAVAADIVDRASGEVLGRTGEAVALARGQQPRELVVRAPGYQDEPLRITPDRDRQVALELRKVRAGKKKAGKSDNALRPINPFPAKKGG